jgi:signal transduction histidine kinase
MTIKLIETAYIFLISVGVIIICILAYLRLLTNRASRTVLSLIHMNETCNHDLHKFLLNAQSLLINANIEDIFYEIAYLGIRFEKKTNSNKPAVRQHIERADYDINIGFIPKSASGENRYINSIVFQTILILIETDILIKIKAINEAFYNFSKLQTFIIHDVKNIAQFAQTLSYNLEHTDNPERESKLINILKKSVPFLSLRANKILDMLGTGKEKGYPDSQKIEIDIKDLIETLVSMYKLPYEIHGNASIFMEEYLISAIFSNILKNVYDKSLQENNVKSVITISNTGTHVKIIFYDTGSHIELIERIFEPFYTTKKDGLGIGLFQAKSMALSVGGEITPRNIENGVEFEVIVPYK